MKEKTIATPKYDCQNCGACCVGDLDDGRGFADVTVEDVARMSRRVRARLVDDGRGARSTPYNVTKELGKSCDFLRGTPGRRVSCRIYATRPEICQKYTPGSGGCMAARADLGMEVRP